MLKIVSSVCAAMMAMTAPFATPALAMPMASPSWAEQGTTQVQYRLYEDRYWDRDGNPQVHRLRRGDYVRRGDRYYLRGHRGYREYRPGYQRYNGWWFPPAAFIAGAIIGGAIANQPPPARYRPSGSAHVEWCYARYRSYRASDNTYQPYNGPRRQCISS